MNLLILTSGVRRERMASPDMSESKSAKTTVPVGNYFRLCGVSKPETLPPEIRGAATEDGLTWFIETNKKLSVKSPHFKGFKPFKVDALSATDYRDLAGALDTSVSTFVKMGILTIYASCSHEVGLARKESINTHFKSHKKQKLMDTIEGLAESENPSRYKLEQMLEDPEILNQWGLIKEGAYLLKSSRERDRQIGWCQEQTLRYWQAQFIQEMGKDGKNDRTIYWVRDTEGNQGKTWLTKYLYRVNPEVTAWVHNGATKDLMKSIIQKASNLELVLFDLSRTNEERVNYDFIERVKNGMIQSTKYEVETIMIDSPTVVCFANFGPDVTKMSLDRWKILNLSENKLWYWGTDDCLIGPVPEATEEGVCGLKFEPLPQVNETKTTSYSKGVSPRLADLFSISLPENGQRRSHGKDRDPPIQNRQPGQSASLPGMRLEERPRIQGALFKVCSCGRSIEKSHWRYCLKCWKSNGGFDQWIHRNK